MKPLISQNSLGISRIEYYLWGVNLSLKSTMKKTFFALGLAGLAFAGCEPRDDTTGGSSNLTVTQDQYALVMETTGSWCGWCPNGAADLKSAMVDFDNILPMAIHNGDPLVTSTTTAFEGAFPTSGVPNFYVGSEDVGQSIQAPITLLLADTPAVGIAHSSKVEDGDIKIESKIAFFDTLTGEVYAQAYFINGPVAADASSIWGDLTQSDYTDDLETVGGLTRWVNPRSSFNGVEIFSAGDVYMHDHSLLAHAGSDAFGSAISSDNSFEAGDTFSMNFTIETDAKWTMEGSHIITILWKKEGGSYVFLNGFID